MTKQVYYENRNNKNGRFERTTHTGLINKRFGKLVVIKDSGERYKRGVIWECLCDCGKKVNIPSPWLKSGNTKSCGCGQQEQYAKHEHNNPTFIDNTEVGMLNPNLMFSHNTSGHRGVSKLKNGKYRAYIQFQKKPYWLGNRDTIEEAIALRKEAEENLFGNFLEWYEKYYNKKKKGE